jgi:predicted Na+-dependent transporter
MTVLASVIFLVIHYLSWYVSIASMFVAGLYLKPRDLKLALQRYKLITKAILANALIIPLIGLALYFTVPMPPNVATAFLLVTFSFGVPLSVNFAKGLRADIPFVTVLLFVLALTTSVTMPVLLDLFLPVSFSIARSFLIVLLYIVIFQLAPLLFGLAFGNSQVIRRTVLRPLGLVTLAATIALFSLVVFVAIAGIVLNWNTVVMVAGRGLGPAGLVAVLTASSLGVGWLLGGPILIDREVLAINSALRNYPIGLLIATSIFSNNIVALAVVVFAAVMVFTVFVFSRIISRILRLTRAQRPPISATEAGASGGASQKM